MPEPKASTDKATEDKAPDKASGAASSTDVFDPRGYVGTSPDDTDRATYALPNPGA